MNPNYNVLNPPDLREIYKDDNYMQSLLDRVDEMNNLSNDERSKISLIEYMKPVQNVCNYILVMFQNKIYNELEKK